MALAESRTGHWGYAVLNMAEGAERNVPRNGNFGRAILEFANKWLKSKKGRKKETSTTWKRTLRVLKSCFSRIAAS